MFGFGKKSFLGIDIGTSAIKIVELKIDNGKPVLSNYARMPVAELGKITLQNSKLFEVTLPQCIRRMIKEAKIKAKNAYVAIPAFGGLITLIDFPEMDKEDMEQAIRYEAHKYIPTSLDEVVLSWDVVGPESVSVDGSKDESLEKKDKVEILLVAASKNKVAQYEKLIRDCGLTLKLIELESFSMVTALIGNDPGTFVIVDIGFRICNIIFVQKGIIKANRNIDAGGQDITRVIAKSLGVNDDRAERMKMSEKKFFSDDSSLNFSALEMITGEVARMISTFSGKQPEFTVDAVILSGGTANLSGLDKYLADQLKSNVIIGNPFGRIEYSGKLASMVEKQGTQFSVATGLALRGVYAQLKNNNK